MLRIDLINKKSISDANKLAFLLLFCGTLYAAAIFQDYISSQINTTGFYWSETMLYNIYWFWLIPFTWLALKIYISLRPHSLLLNILFLGTISLVLTISHILVFTQLFVTFSRLLFSNPHRYGRIFESALSNQAYITFIIYAFVPLLIRYFRKIVPEREALHSMYDNSITVRKGSNRISIKVEHIQSIVANKPYTEITTNGTKYLHNGTLKKFESTLDPKMFIRVHRSVLVNKLHIVGLKSRGNGDYDATLTSGSSVRFSRHYRNYWAPLASTGI
ncbi:LytR/AlgR family response regulator transcription factor [Maribacter halichondriae]|uniref:LytR/AlgR family response regulator transcription factor n=1 Tax=Maribacter halichondriae TaxID=2980554 RepID=UPI002359FA03|nr:LytTR family DNA-binding domain-containing protein [Maribacter sp. Hal144]